MRRISNVLTVMLQDGCPTRVVRFGQCKKHFTQSVPLVLKTYIVRHQMTRHTVL